MTSATLTGLVPAFAVVVIYVGALNLFRGLAR